MEALIPGNARHAAVPPLRLTILRPAAKTYRVTAVEPDGTRRRAPVNWTIAILEGRQMKRAILLAGLACAALVPGASAQQAPNPPPNQVNDPTGTPPGVMPMQNHNSVGFPAPRMIEGQPIETRQPELEG